jgi:hypothetical protein
MRNLPFRRLTGIVFTLALTAGCPSSDGDGGGASGAGGAGGTSTTGGRGGSQAGGRGGATGGSGGATGGTGGSASGGAGGAVSGCGGAGAGGSSSGGAGGSSSGGAGGEGAPDASSDGAPPASGSYTKLIKLDTTPAGADVAGDVPKYPVAIVLDATSFDFSQAKPKGEDIRFAGADGKALPFEIEYWDATAKLAGLWVKVDVKGNSTQTIKMTWGDAAAVSASDGKAVFPMEDGYLGVWHLSEPGSTTPGGYKDSSANAAHATGVAMTPDGTGEGRIGKAILLANAKMQWAEVPAEKTVLAPEKMTYSIWLSAKSHTVEYQAMFSKGEGDFRLHYFGKAEYYGNRHLTESCLESSVSNDVCPVNRSSGTDVKPGAGWFHILAIHNHPETSYYVNGKFEAKINAPEKWKTNATAKVMIGNNSSNTRRAFDGYLDEARLMVVAKDANWAKLEYESQRAGQKFVSFMNAP